MPFFTNSLPPLLSLNKLFQSAHDNKDKCRVSGEDERSSASVTGGRGGGGEGKLVFCAQSTSAVVSGRYTFYHHILLFKSV